MTYLICSFGEALRLAPPDQPANQTLAKLIETSVKRNADAISGPEEIKRRAEELKARLIRPEVYDDTAIRQKAVFDERKAAVAARVAEYETQSRQA